MKSAKQKAESFVTKWGLAGDVGDKTLLVKSLTTLLLKHEKDTRYKAIEVLQELEVGGGDQYYEDGHYSHNTVDSIALHEAIDAVQNLEVSDED